MEKTKEKLKLFSELLYDYYGLSKIMNEMFGTVILNGVEYFSAIKLSDKLLKYNLYQYKDTIEYSGEDLKEINDIFNYMLKLKAISKKDEWIKLPNESKYLSYIKFAKYTTKTIDELEKLK